MITPDICTGSCETKPQKHCYRCCHAFYIGKLDIPGIFTKFEFNPQFGVKFQSNDEYMSRQPGMRNKKVWDAWEKWFDITFEKEES